MAISMLKIRRPLRRLIFNMGIAIPGKTVFLIETAPRVRSSNMLNAHVWYSVYQGTTVLNGIVTSYPKVIHTYTYTTQTLAIVIFIHASFQTLIPAYDSTTVANHSGDDKSDYIIKLYINGKVLSDGTIVFDIGFGWWPQLKDLCPESF